MERTTSTTDLLLQEMRSGALAAQPYSRKSLYGRYEQLALTTVAACIAVLGSIAVCELTKPL